MSVGGSAHSLRRALGALKDSTTVGLVKVNSENKGLDVAIVKATNHDEVSPKEKHVMTIFDSLSASRSRADVAYCINGLTKRLCKTHNWTVALKTLVVIHRAMREVDPTFHEELVNCSRGARLMFNLSHFRDDSSPIAWDCSAWVRAYALYLEERLQCFRMLKYDMQKNHSLWTMFFPQTNARKQRKKKFDILKLFEQLPAMQQLLFRLLGCMPEGMAVHNGLVHYALSIVAGESVKLYVAITDGILKMVDKYFEMDRHEAIRALEIYKKATSQGEQLSKFFEVCSSLDFGRQQKYIKIETPPASFLRSMEEYVAEAPHALALEWIQINEDECGTPTEICVPRSLLSIEYKYDGEEKSAQHVPSSDASNNNQNDAASTAILTDLLGFDDLTVEPSEVDDKNIPELAIIPSDNSVNGEASVNSTSQNTSWEIALVTAPSSNGAAVATSKLAGGLDKLTLDSLYDNAMVTRTSQNGANQMGQMTTSNPFESFGDNQDPIHASSDIAPATNFQTVPTSQEQALLMMQQQQPNITGLDSSNPFGNPYVNNMPDSFVDDNVPVNLPQSSNSSLI